MSKKLTPKQDYYQGTHEAALALRQAKAIAEAAIQSEMVAETKFRTLVDPFGLFVPNQIKMVLDKWADDPPQAPKETP